MSDAMITRRGGGGSARLQSKPVVPAPTASIVSPDSGYDGLSSVTVAAITPQKEAQIYTPGTADQIIAADRWLAGQQTILGDVNLLAANIKKGVSIFGIAGAYEAGLDTNSAILKVVTSAGCSVTVTNGTDTFTQQAGHGFVRPNDANVTEHFFVIPAAAFGTYSVTSTHPTYGGNTKTNAVVVGNAGKVYEVLCGGKNIILNSTFGLQDGLQLYDRHVTYDNRTKRINIDGTNAGWMFGGAGDAIPVAAYTKIKCTALTSNGGNLYLQDHDNSVLASLLFNTRVTLTSRTGDITNKYYDKAGIYYSAINYVTEIVLT